MSVFYIRAFRTLNPSIKYYRSQCSISTTYTDCQTHSIHYMESETPFGAPAQRICGEWLTACAVRSVREQRTRCHHAPRCVPTSEVILTPRGQRDAREDPSPAELLRADPPAQVGAGCELEGGKGSAGKRLRTDIEGIFRGNTANRNRANVGCMPRHRDSLIVVTVDLCPA